MEHSDFDFWMVAMSGRVDPSRNVTGTTTARVWLAALAIGLSAASVTGASTKLPAPGDLNIRIVGTASFQGRQTALIEDMNTRSDSFYRVGDPIYGYQITAITAEGIALEKNGQQCAVAFEASAGMKPTDSLPAKTVLANTYLLPEQGAIVSKPNFYTEMDLTNLSAKVPAMAGNSVLARASAGAGRFLLPLATYKRLSSGFGYRKHPIGGGSKMHKGLDLSANRGTRILSADGGTVTFSGWKGGYGYCIIVSHHNGYETLYGHCSKLIADVGDNVRRGDLIAEVGSTGASTGNHLHFEVHKDTVAVDPEPFIADQL